MLALGIAFLIAGVVGLLAGPAIKRSLGDKSSASAKSPRSLQILYVIVAVVGLGLLIWSVADGGN